MDLAPDKPIAGLLAPLFAIRSSHDLGIGDTAALRHLIDWAAGIGFRLIQLLPINETGSDNSPYNAISSVAIDPGTIAISPATLKDLPKADYEEILAGADLEKMRSGPVDYPAVRALKRSLLWRAFENFSKKPASGRREYNAFVKKQAAWLEGYALFRLLMEENGAEAWTEWPAENRSPAAATEWIAGQTPARRREMARKLEFFKYVQWIAFRQWMAVREYANSKGVALMGDVPYGVSYYSADVFSQPECFDLDWSSGAPPEPYFKDDEFTQKWGQNWGMPVYRWDRMRGDSFSWWRQRVRMVREIFNLFRIDHVLGFYRIYGFPWRPERNAEFLPLSHDEARARTGEQLPHFIPRDDLNGDDAEANRREGEEYLRALLEESGEHRLIGEDLGSVPDYVRPSLTSLGIAGFKIPIWEKGQHGNLTPGGEYQQLSVATYATHDHEPIRALWERWARTAREHPDEHARNAAIHEMWLLCGFAGLTFQLPREWDDGIHEALLRALFASDSWIGICMITDLFATTQRFNVPGSVVDSNWSERLPHTVQQWKQSKPIKAKMEKVKEILLVTGRVSSMVSEER